MAEKKPLKEEIISTLLRNKIRLHKSIIETFGVRYRFHPKTKGQWFDRYDAFNSRALQNAYACFVNHEIDKTGRFLEYRFAHWLSKKDKAIKKIDFDKRLSFGEIDIIGYNDKNEIITIAECKSKRARYMGQGGIQLQFNIVDTETLLDAQKHPEHHRDLIVRVWGFSAYFVTLSREYQENIIARNEHTF